MRRSLGARAAGGGRAPHRRRRARPRPTAQGGRAGVLARHAAGLQPARGAEKRHAVQRLARRAACGGARGSLRAEPHPAFVPGNRVRRDQPPGALALPRRRRDRDDAPRAARSRLARDAGRERLASQARGFGRALCSPAAMPGKGLSAEDRVEKHVFRLGAAFLGAARGGGLPRRARERLRRVPGDRQVARGARRAGEAGARLEAGPDPAGVRLARASLPRDAVPERRRRPGGADPGPRRARVGGAALRLPVGERADRRGLAARCASESVHPRGPAEEGRRAAGLAGNLRRARSPPHRRMARRGGRSRGLLARQRGRPRPHPEPAHRVRFRRFA